MIRCRPQLTYHVWIYSSLYSSATNFQDRAYVSNKGYKPKDVKDGLREIKREVEFVGRAMGDKIRGVISLIKEPGKFTFGHLM